MKKISSYKIGMILIILFMYTVGVKAQNFPKDAFELKRWELNDLSKLKEISSFSYKSSKDKSEEYYLATINSKTIGLFEKKSNKLLNKFIQMPIQSGGSNCSKDEADQWAYFNAKIAPKLINQANKTCKPVFYCVCIYCKGKPRVCYYIVFMPNSSKCLQSGPRIKDESLKYIFKN